MSRQPKSVQHAAEVILKYPEADHYVEANFSNGVGGHGEYWDNTMDTHVFWHLCNELVKENQWKIDRDPFYKQLYKEFSRDYPRHHWAEDPLRAPPILIKRLLPKPGP